MFLLTGVICNCNAAAITSALCQCFLLPMYSRWQRRRLHKHKCVCHKCLDCWHKLQNFFKKDFSDKDVLALLVSVTNAETYRILNTRLKKQRHVFCYEPLYMYVCKTAGFCPSLSLLSTFICLWGFFSFFLKLFILYCQRALLSVLWEVKFDFIRWNALSKIKLNINMNDIKRQTNQNEGIIHQNYIVLWPTNIIL